MSGEEQREVGLVGFSEGGYNVVDRRVQGENGEDGKGTGEEELGTVTEEQELRGVADPVLDRRAGAQEVPGGKLET